MNYTTRSLSSSLIGLLLIGIGMAAMGLHLSSIVQATSLLIVGGFSMGLLFLYRNPKEIFATIRRLSKSDTLTWDDITTLESLERTNLMGSVFGAILGLTHATINFMTPDLIGPSIAVSLVCLLYGFLANSLVIMPLKQRILSTELVDKRDISANRSFPWSKIIGAFIGIILITSGFLLEGADFEAHSVLASMLAAIGPVVAILLGAKNFPRLLFSPMQRHLLSDALMSGSVISVLFHAMVIMQNLMQPEIIRSQIMASTVILITGFIGTLGLRDDPWSGKIEPNAREPYFTYGCISVGAIALCAIEVLVATHYYR